MCNPHKKNVTKKIHLDKGSLVLIREETFILQGYNFHHKIVRLLEDKQIQERETIMSPHFIRWQPSTVILCSL